ncbi:MAG: SulP family inorganic anion transporter [Candidatus Sumerlaeota bacterium]|nr:SulP family inorganic anion transporter [Candidatus Sumerlaeota bacterium]
MNSIQIHKYLKEDLSYDVIASLSVTAISIPQAVAYAIIAGAPPVYGLYTGIVTGILGAIFRSSCHIIMGPTNATAMIIAGTLQPHFNPDQLPSMILLLTFLTGLVQVSFGVLRLGGIVRYVSNSVVIGLTAGAGVLIAGEQLAPLFGLQNAIPRKELSFFLLGVVRVCLKIVDRIIAWDLPLPTLLLGLFNILFIILCRKVAPRLPSQLLAVVLSTIFVRIFEWFGYHGIFVLGQMGEEITRQWNIFHIPEPIAQGNLEAAGAIFPGAVAVALLGVVETVSVARAISVSTGQRVDFNREFIGKGMANVIGAFFRCFSASASFVRSMTNLHAGARTRMSGVFVGIWTAVILLAFAPCANHIPIASLSGLLIVIAANMIDRQAVRQAWATGAASRAVLLVTFGATIVFGLKYAIFVGVAASIVFLLRATGEPSIRRILIHPDGAIEELPANSPSPIHTPVALVDLSGDFYFAAVHDLDLKLRYAIPPETRVLILRMREMRLMGSTGVGILSRFCRTLRDQGVTVILSGVEEDMEQTIRDSGLSREIGEENLFYADAFVFRATQLAFARARALVEAQDNQIRRPAAGEGGEAIPVSEKAEPCAQDIMRQNVIRFGVKHRLREAVWLLREGRKRKKEMSCLFLQGDDARIAGMVDILLVLRQFHRAAKTIAQAETGAEDYHGKEIMRKTWLRIHRHRLRTFVSSALPTVLPSATLSEVRDVMLKYGLEVVPVTLDGRAIGQVYIADLIAKLKPKGA